MHPEIVKSISALRAGEMQAAAAAARLAGQVRAGQSLQLPGSGSAAFTGGQNARRLRLLGRWFPVRPRPA